MQETPLHPRLARAALLAGSVALLAGCASVPHLGAEPMAKPAASYAVTQSFAAPDGNWPSDQWWTAYGDAQLDGLVTEALAGAPSLAEAEARVRRAQSFAEQSGAVLKPQLAAEASVMETKQSLNQGVPSAFVPHGWREVGRAGLDLSWQLDLFGKNRALLAAATSEVEAARADAALARLRLSTGVAGAYADLTQLYADRDAAEGALRIRREGERLIAQRAAQGLETRAALERAHAGRAGVEAELARIDEAIGLTRNGLAALLGQGPDRGLAIGRPSPRAIRALGLPQNLAADLVGRRPDVVAARLAAEAAGHRIKAAKADFYPNVNLVGFVGVQSLGLDMLAKSGSTLGAVGPAVSLPIFSGGRLEGAYRGARADYDTAVAAYDATLVQALRDVADAAVSSRALDARLAKSREAAAASQAAYDLSRDRYGRGLGTYLDVLVAEDGLIADRRTVADLETRAFTLDVALVRALGGGFRA
ncbi:MAG: efflux transporter outer membrane subunit [Caulobacter sp.]|nr:efflux transporter outer membrane subunit [Caulobacter sp.]